MTEKKRPKIGLALGSGGAKGISHVGVIKILEENNIPIDFIAGSSIGAMVGGFYAAGLNIEKIKDISQSASWRDVFSVLFDPHLKQGLISGKKVVLFIEKYLNEKKLENCKIPFVAVTTNLKTGETVPLNKGKLSSAIRASVSMPLIFKPVKIEGKTLIDGGVSAPVPVEIVRSMGADLVIAVNLQKYYYDENFKIGWYNTANDSLNIMFHHLALLNTATADVVINIDNGKSLWYQFANGHNKVLAGEEATKKILPQLKELINKKTEQNRLNKILDFYKLLK